MVTQASLRKDRMKFHKALWYASLHHFSETLDINNLLGTECAAIERGVADERASQGTLLETGN